MNYGLCYILLLIIEDSRDDGVSGTKLLYYGNKVWLLEVKIGDASFGSWWIWAGKLLSFESNFCKKRSLTVYSQASIYGGSLGVGILSGSYYSILDSFDKFMLTDD